MSTPIGDYPQPAFCFRVTFKMSKVVFATSFQEVSGIGPEIETEDVIEGGQNRYVHRLPKALKYPRLVLKRCVAMGTSPLIKWCKKCLEADFSQKFNSAQISVSLLDESHNPIATWSFSEAYPVHWEIESFNSMKNEVAIEKIELNYSYSTREA